jgi:hypothetical protein
MSSLLLYNVENSTNEEKSLNECHGRPPLHLKRRGEARRIGGPKCGMVCVHDEYLIKESTEH